MCKVILYPINPLQVNLLQFWPLVYSEPFLFFQTRAWGKIFKRLRRAHAEQFLWPFYRTSLQTESMWWVPLNFSQPPNLIAAIPDVLMRKLAKCDYLNCPELMRKDQRPNTSWRLNDIMGHCALVTHGFPSAMLPEEWTSHWGGEK